METEREKIADEKKGEDAAASDRQWQSVMVRQWRDISVHLSAVVAVEPTCSQHSETC